MVTFNKGVVWVGLSLALCTPWVQAQSTATIRGFKVQGNTLIASERIETALASFLGPRTGQELRQAAQVVQALYREEGYGGVLASVFSPGVDGVAEVRVLEGKMGRITVVGADQFSSESVRAAVPALTEGQTPRVKELNRQLELANQNPARKLAVTLEPGQRIGAVDAQILTTESPVLQSQFAVDNTGNEQSGRTRLSAGMRHANVGGLGHQATALIQTSAEQPSRVAIVSATYVWPLPRSGQKVEIYGTRSNVEGGTNSTAAGALSFSGQGSVLGGQWTQLLPRNADRSHRVRVGLERRDYRNQCAIAGLPEGACGAAGESVAVQPLSLEYSVQGGQQWAWALHVTGIHNLGAGGSLGSKPRFEAIRLGAPRGYRVLRWGGQAQWRFSAQWQGSVRVLGQWSPKALIPGEQFGPAGASAVRGYRERELTGDSGWLLGAELRMPGWSWGSQTTTELNPVVFADWARVWNHEGFECRAGQTACTLAAVGFGVRASHGRWRLILDWAQVQRAALQTQRQDSRVHLAASYGLE